MKKFIAIFVLSVFASSLVLAEEISIMADPQNCLGCHDDLHADWLTSLHAKSHEDSNELYKKAVGLVASETKQIYEQVLVSCGTCHNPRLETKSISDDIALASMLGIQTAQTKELQEKMASESVKNGISCFVCHNVDRVKYRSDQKQNGYKLFEWTQNDLIVGPYDLKDEPPLFHMSEERPIFRTNNDLCLACHQGQATISPNSMYNTGEEMVAAQSTELCIDCHMKSNKTEIIAPDMQRENMVPREIKSHFFEGARNSDILKNAIELSIEKIGQNEAKLFVKNLISHGIPSGFSGRSLVFDIYFLKGEEVLQTKNIDMRAVYKNSLLYETLSYAAKAKGEDTRLKPYEKREISLGIPDGTTDIKVSVGYFVIAPQLQEVLKIQNEEFTKKYDVLEQTFSVK
ncbi:MAG: hypothetical protein J6U11_02585 [Campylobacter sp.]|nr:hypothetical protein [Campylobacter sp.]